VPSKVRLSKVVLNEKNPFGGVGVVIESVTVSKGLVRSMSSVLPARDRTRTEIWLRHFASHVAGQT
jgi:hypothetical protein